MDQEICILLTTYQRTEMALKTIIGIQNYLKYSNLSWYVSDDGSGSDHNKKVLSAIHPSYTVRVFNSARHGVGHGMNYCLRKIFAEITPLVLVMEDDWYLDKPFDIKPYASFLLKDSTAGMVRFGYLSPGIAGDLISAENKLMWKIRPNGYQYRFAGHPSLRHSRFHQIYGYYDEGLSPGQTELSMCGKVNARPNGPGIYFPAECNAWGFWGHIGAESLADVNPES